MSQKIQWETVKCSSCGWFANRMLRVKALTRVCPHCKEKKLGPA